MVTGTDILVRIQTRSADIPHRALALSVLISILVFIGCGGGPHYTIGGTIAGLSGSGLVLLDNGGNNFTVSASATSFTFTTEIANGSAYSVTVSSQPSNPSQTCSVSSGSGAVTNANVTSVVVTCIPDYTVGGTIAGLSGSGLVLLDNGGNDLTGNANATSFTFTTEIANGGAYSVTVLSQPSNPSQTCTVSSGSGTVIGANVTSVAVTCIPLPQGFVGFVATGSMTIGRELHTATLLNNGKVLITGGAIDVNITTGVTDTAELFDPATGTFTATGRMTTVREGQTATLLNNGQVLIAGGDIGDCDTVCTLASAELYNAATGTFTATGNMNDSRTEFTATLLNNGKVLIAGGFEGSPYLASAELYDPATGTFTATGSMTIARQGPTATLLSNGMVLFAGGIEGGSPTLAIAELYDPTTGIFSSTGSMTDGRVGHTATLLNNGQVLIAGGGNPSGELFNPATGTFTATGNMSVNISGQTATLLNNGQVLIAGGNEGPGFNGDVFTASAQLYNPATGTFTSTGNMTTARWGHTATLLNNGNVLVAGGVASSSATSPYLASAELYVPGNLTPTGLVSITLSPATPTLSVGSTQQFVATGTFSDSSTQNLQSVTWSSSNQAAGTITNDASDHGVALALAAGNSTITASAGSVSASTVLTVQ